MPQPSIPPELIDRIIDHLHNDKRALSACALTCHVWLTTARYHRFTTVTLVPARIRSFLDLLERPGIAHVVLKLELRGMQTWSFQPRGIQWMLSQLRSLEHLSLYRMHIEDEISLVPTMPLKSLSIESSVVIRADVLLASFSSIGRLVVRSSNLSPDLFEYATPSLTENTNDSKIPVLCLGPTQLIRDIFTTALTGKADHGIRDFYMHIVGRRCAIECANVFQVLGATLEHVNLLFNSDSSPKCGLSESFFVYVFPLINSL